MTRSSQPDTLLISDSPTSSDARGKNSRWIIISMVAILLALGLITSLVAVLVSYPVLYGDAETMTATLSAPLAKPDSASSAANNDSLTFVVLGDWGRIGPETVQLAKTMKKVCVQDTANMDIAPCQFVLAVGDNVYPSGIQSVNDSTLHEIFEGVYKNIDMRWYVILGNHDWYGNPEVEIEYTSLQDRWYLPSHYYSQLVSFPTSDFEVQLSFLDTTPMIDRYYKTDKINHDQLQHQNSFEQLNWLNTTLAEPSSTRRWKLVVGHHPVYSVSHHGDTPELKDVLRPMLRDYKVNAYFCGHDHNLQHIRDKDKAEWSPEYLLSGGGGTIYTQYRSDKQDVKFFGPYQGFMMVNINHDVMSVYVYNAYGTIVYSYRVGFDGTDKSYEM